MSRTWMMDEERTVNIYHVDKGLLFGGIAATTLLVVLVAPTFAGWWELGRPVSLDPVETAKAFDAPLLRGPGSNAAIGDLVRIVGGRRLKWGDVEDSNERVLRFAQPGAVLPPKQGVVYE